MSIEDMKAYLRKKAVLQREYESELKRANGILRDAVLHYEEQRQRAWEEYQVARQGL